MLALWTQVLGRRAEAKAKVYDSDTDRLLVKQAIAAGADKARLAHHEELWGRGLDTNISLLEHDVEAAELVRARRQALNTPSPSPAAPVRPEPRPTPVVEFVVDDQAIEAEAVKAAASLGLLGSGADTASLDAYVTKLRRDHPPHVAEEILRKMQEIKDLMR